VLEATGLVAVPGSGFHQRPGTYHFRMTFLPRGDVLDDVLARLAAFHHAFLKEFDDSRQTTPVSTASSDGFPSLSSARSSD
jgi:hypothetical protein